MFQSSRKLLFLMVLWMVFIKVNGQQKIIEGDSIVIVEAVLKKMNTNLNFVIVPGPVYNSATNLGFAILPMFTYNVSRKDSLSPPSSTSALLYMNFYGSWFIAAQQNLYFGQNKWRMISSIGYGDLRTKFFGIARDTAVVRNNDYVFVNQKTFIFTLSGYRKIYSGLYGGLEYSYFNINLRGVDSTASSAVNKAGVDTGNHSESQLIPGFVWDNRDDIFWSSRGFYSHLNFHFGSHWLLGDHDYFLISGFVSGYHKLLPHSKKLILAWRFFMQGSWGDVPYYQLANFGSGDGFRGYTHGKYVNHSEVNAQLELRYDLWKFISITGFLGSGKTFGQISDFGQSVWLHSGGVGLYLTVIRSRNIRVGLNLAISRHDYGLYVGLNQSF